MTKQSLVTVESLQQLLKDQHEAGEPQDSILKFFQQNEGKRVDKRFIAKLKAFVGDESITTHYVAGMTSIVWGGNETGLLFTYGAPIANSADLLKYNARYFDAKDERNQKREALAKDTKRLARIAAAINAYNASLVLMDAEFGPEPNVPYSYSHSDNPDDSDMMRLAHGYDIPLTRKNRR